MAPATDNLLPQHDAALRDREAQLGHVLETAYAPAARDLQSRLDSFLSAMVAARIPALVSRVDAQLTAFARIADTLIQDAQRDAAGLGSDHAQALITAGVQPPAGVSVSWNRLPIEAIEQLVGRAFDGSPLSSLLDQIGPEVAAIVRQALLTGLASGAGPRQIARIFQDAIDGGYKRALLIAKTETLNAYRAAALANYQANSDVVDEWEWSADSAACDICAAKDGTRYPLAAPFDEHPGGRCAPIPVTKDWADLGIEMHDEATWEAGEAALWDVVSFDYTTQERDERGRWVAGAGAAAKQALKARHQAERAALRASHASARSDLRAAHAGQRAAAARGQRGALNEGQRAERAALRQTHAQERGRLSEAHAQQRGDLERGATGRIGHVSQAYGTDPNQSYQMQHRLVDLSEIHASNTASGGINPDYDPRLQPRDRSRSASQAQIDEVARKMNPDVLLTDFHAIDRGTPIIDEHGNVLSGNGRTLALAHAAERYPENYDQYKARLRAQAESLGLDPAAVDRMDRPILVRELQGAADPVAFAREANSSGTLRMSPLEQAKVDAQILQDRSVLKLNVDEGQNIDQALRARDNRPFVDDFLASIPENERAYLLTRDGQLNQMGLYRAKAAVYTRVFEGEAGNRMAESMLESLDPELKNVQTGISQSLPQIARAKALIGSGARASDLDITEDSAKAIDALARIKDNTSLTAGTPAHLVVDKYLGQAQMFGRELTPNQEVLLKHFDSISRKPAEIKDFFSRYAQLVEHSPAVGQSDLFGPSHALSRSELIAQLVGRVSAPAQAQIGMFSRMRVLFASIAGGLPPVRKRSDYTDITPDDLVWSLFYDRIAGNPDALTVGALTANFTYEVPAMPPTTPTDPIAPVTRRGPIFKLGAYPDKQFSLSADEARRAVASFTPVAIDSEHKQSIFDGKLGQLKGVTLDGDVLYGEMDVPQWLHDLFPEQPIPVSTTWHRQQKQIIGLALAANPRVSDAAMMTAFSATFARHDTFEGQQAMQELHDHAARNGAICNSPAKMHSAHEVSAMQKVHDTTIAHGARCNSMAAMSANTEEHPMKMFDSEFWASFFRGAQAAERAPELAPAAFGVVGEPLAKVTASADADEVKRLRDELAKAKAERITSDATHFADEQIAGHKALPAEREAIIAAFTQAAQDDGQHGAVTFDDGKTSTSRVAQLKAMFTARPAHTLTQELVKTQEGDAAAFAADNKTQQQRDLAAAQPMSKERRAELLGLTDIGRDVLRNGNGS
jgi:SPP1 gp7 family putative phage head morphogenesis protein